MPACLLTEKYDVPTTYRTFSSASCSIFPAIDRDGNLPYIATSCLPGAVSSSMPRRWMISRKRRLPQIPNRSTITEVGLVQHGLCVGYATHESLSFCGKRKSSSSSTTLSLSKGRGPRPSSSNRGRRVGSRQRRRPGRITARPASRGRRRSWLG